MTQNETETETPEPPASLQSQTQDQPQGPSHLLAAAREHLGLSQEEVAQRLHLDASVIACIDANDFQNISIPVYIKGYLRAYAGLVGLSGDKVVAMFDDMQQSEEPADESSGTAKNLSMTIATSVIQMGFIGLFLLAVIVALVWWLARDGDKPALEISWSEDTEAVLEDIEFPVDDSSEAPASEQLVAISPVPEKTNAPAPARSQAEDLAAAETAAPPPPQDETQPEAAATETLDQLDEPEVQIARERRNNGNYITIDAGGADQLEFTFTDDCWIEITDARTKIYANLHRDQDQIIARATAPFNILLGEVNAVQMIYNGRQFDITPHIRSDGSARLVLAD
ncbi:MAG: RodZ domain-containing protein [Pseudomonadales bacterium]